MIYILFLMYNYLIALAFEQQKMSIFCKKSQPSEEEIQKALKDRMKQYYKYEEDVLSLNGLRFGIDFHVYDVPVSWDGKEYTVHTYEAGKQNEETLVMFHGYGGSNVHFSRLYPHLVKKFRILSIDLPGMGFSSKKDIHFETAEECSRFFVGVINAWRMALNLEQFCLAGHSFGGYIATLYAVKYPELIKHLYLISPAGGTHYTEQELNDLRNFDSLPWFKRWAINYAKSFWDSQTTPIQMVDKWYGPYFLKRYLSKRMRLEGTEYETWKRYKEVLYTLPEGSEKALFVLFVFPRVYTKVSIQYLLTTHKNECKFKVLFLFGDSDWMDSKGANQLNQTYDDINCKIIPDCGHQLQLENPQMVAQAMIDDLFAKQQENQQNIL